MDWKQVYERQTDRVYRTAMMYLKNADDAEDVVQGVFLRFLEKGPDFKDEQHEKAWFLTVTRNYCKDVQKNFWRRNVDLGTVPEGETQKENETAKEVLDAVLTLQVKYREVIYLYYYEGYPVKEIAGMLHRKESTVQTQLADARKKLKAELERGGIVHG